MESRLTNKQITEKADLKFLKVSETIFKVEKDRRGDFSGSSYVSDTDVLNSLNDRDVIIYNDTIGLSIHKNF